jgi:pimeloyl-ACP methyl ester carboxylesterase
MPAVSVGERTCFYQDVGKGYPVLFGHSYLWDSNMWAPQIESLSKEYRCIAVDLWDHGSSTHLNTPTYSIPQLADDYWALLEHLGISECAVIGLSVGGMWGTELALKHPQAITALALMDTYVGAEPEATQIKYFALLDIIEQAKGFPPALIEQITPLFFSPTTLSENPTLISRFKESLTRTEEQNVSGIVTLGRAIFSRQGLLDKLPSIMQPTLVITGKDDIPRPPSEAEEMAHLLPNADLHIIENAGHICNLEKPHVVTNILKSFLSQTVTHVN